MFNYFFNIIFLIIPYYFLNQFFSSGKNETLNDGKEERIAY